MKRIFAFFLVALISCDNSTEPGKIDQPERNYSHEDSTEAIELAVWLYGKLNTTDSDVETVLYSINKLRDKYMDSSSVIDSIILKNRFRAPWKLGELVMKFDSVTAEQIRAGTYNGWITIESNLQPLETLRQVDNLGWASYRINASCNPWRIAEIYKNLPGVIFAEPNLIDSISGLFPLYPGLADGEMTYLFVKNYFLPGGGPMYFFKFNGDEPVYMGIWSRNMQPKPDWYDWAESNYENFYEWKRYP